MKDESEPRSLQAPQSVRQTKDPAGDAAGAPLSRRDVVGGAAFFGAAMALVRERAVAQDAASGSQRERAMAQPPPAAGADSADELEKTVRIARAMRAGPPEITRDATIAEMDHHGNMTKVLRPGTNGWTCVPGDENKIGDPPMCVDELGM